MLTFITSNKGKAQEVRDLLQLGDELQILDSDLVEIQGSADEIIRAKIACAVKKYPYISGDLLVEDTSLYLDALDDHPGPYIKHFLKDVGLHGIHRLVEALGNTEATAECNLGYYDSVQKSIHIIRGQAFGNIVAPRGTNGFGFDPIFETVDQSEALRLTFAEMAPEVKNIISERGLALVDFKAKYAARDFNPCPYKGCDGNCSGYDSDHRFAWCECGELFQDCKCNTLNSSISSDSVYSGVS